MCICRSGHLIRLHASSLLLRRVLPHTLPVHKGVGNIGLPALRACRWGFRAWLLLPCAQVLILGWCDSQRDLEVVQKVVSQLCHAYEAEGGRVIVVMTQRAKLELEALFRRILPPPQRYGSQLVFRQARRLPAWRRLIVSVDSWVAIAPRQCLLARTCMFTGSCLVPFHSTSHRMGSAFRQLHSTLALALA